MQLLVIWAIATLAMIEQNEGDAIAVGLALAMTATIVEKWTIAQRVSSGDDLIGAIAFQ